MLDIRWKAGLFIGALSTICIFLWLITSSVIALIIFSFGLLIYLASHIYWLHQLQNWLKTPVLQEIPEGSGLWEDVYAALLRYERNNHLKQTELN
ncbi:MAG: DUF3329 domain-containing protein, partial [Methylotenera sp.]|nr:DUF3329 domain-containing protein [Methylotenera sp.]